MLLLTWSLGHNFKYHRFYKVSLADCFHVYFPDAYFLLKYFLLTLGHLFICPYLGGWEEFEPVHSLSQMPCSVQL